MVVVSVSLEDVVTEDMIVGVVSGVTGNIDPMVALVIVVRMVVLMAIDEIIMDISVTTNVDIITIVVDYLTVHKGIVIVGMVVRFEMAVA